MTGFTTLSGGCFCGAVRYEISAPPTDVALCHCVDCRRNAGAPVMAWAGCASPTVTITKGAPATYQSSADSIRSFCAKCGTGLFYQNEKILPGITEVQAATLDNPEALAPTLQIQVAERLGWMKTMHTLPEVDRFP